MQPLSFEALKPRGKLGALRLVRGDVILSTQVITGNHISGVGKSDEYVLMFIGSDVRHMQWFLHPDRGLCYRFGMPFDDELFVVVSRV